MLHVDKGRLHAYLDGELSEREHTAVARHLSVCADCQAAYKAAAILSRRASQLTAELEPGAVSAPSWREIEERAAAQRGKARRRSWIRPSTAWAASIAIAFGLGWFSSSYWMRFPASLDSLSGSGGISQPAPVRVTGEAAVDERLSEKAGGPAGPQTPLKAKEFEEADRANENDLELEPTEPGYREAPSAAPEARRDLPLAPTAVERDQATADDRGRAKPAAADAVAPPPESEVVRQVAEPQADRAVLRARAEGAHPDVAKAGGQQTEARSFADAQKSVTPAELVIVSGALGSPLRLSGQLRSLPELTLRNVEAGRGSTADGDASERPVIRLTYEDAAGQIITLTQVWLDGDAVLGEDAPVLEVNPSGLNSYRWVDGNYRLTLTGAISSDSLRALAARVE